MEKRERARRLNATGRGVLRFGGWTVVGGVTVFKLMDRNIGVKCSGGF